MLPTLLNVGIEIKKWGSAMVGCPPLFFFDVSQYVHLTSSHFRNDSRVYIDRAEIESR